MARRASDRDPALDQTPEAEPIPEPAPEPTPSPLEGGHPGEYVRVKHPETGDHFTTTRALARRMGATLLPDHDAVDKHGQPLPRKPKNSKES